jgi:valyl-tRNA synthetase
LPIIEDDYVDPEFGTGVVKVTPAHDPNDFEMGRRHNLPTINVMNDDGTMNEAAGSYVSLDRFECRKKLVEDLKTAGFIEKIEDHQYAIGHCYRCDTIVEPRLSLQWFVKMKPLARPAIEAVKEGKIQFIPERWTKVYLEWMENIRDWCISRQIWWGHRIPIFYCDACGNEWASKKKEEKCPKCSSQKIRQDEDVLDTWFSSWLWPFSTLGWPEKNDDLAFFYPTDTLVTASEIIFFWVARMIMAGIETMKDIPFRKVFIHGTVRDDIGRKMSKSLGNSIDPLEIINEYSADALRFSLMMVTPVGQDVYLSKEKFEVGRNFLTKIWNAARFIQMNMESADINARDAADKPFTKELLSPEDQHIIANLYETIGVATEHLERFRLNDYAKELYDFIWHKFCDWYIEAAKLPLSSENTEKILHTLQVIHHVFSRILKLVHPVAPFITEELYHALGYGNQEKREFLINARWPEQIEPEKLSESGISRKIVDYVETKHELIKIARSLRADYGIPPNEKLDYVIKPENEFIATLTEKDKESLALLLKAKSLKIAEKDYAPHKMINGITKSATIFASIEGVIDIEQETARLKEQLAKTTKDISTTNKKLSNIDFIEKAPADVVEQQKTRKQELIEKAEKIERLIALLQEAKK